MAQQYYPIDLTSGVFPMLSEQQTRTVIGSEVGKAPSAEARPHLAYCHNALPSEKGYDAVAYIDEITKFPNLSSKVSATQIKLIYSTSREKKYLAWDSRGSVYVINAEGTAWIKLANVPIKVLEELTFGTVNGVTYILYPLRGMYVYDSETYTLNGAVTTGIDLLTIQGITASSGYLIVHTDTAIAWSSLLDPLDFTPSDITGAGGGSVAGISGSISFCVANTSGFLIYSEGNVISASYTGNSVYPFKFREVDNSKGGIYIDQVASSANSTVQYVHSKAGLQGLTSQKASDLYPEATDFLAGRSFEDYDEVTKELVLTELGLEETMKKALAYVAARYLVISYGLPGDYFTHALVIDTTLQRVGKLKIDHVDVIEYVAGQSEISKESIGLLGVDGNLKVVNFAVSSDAKGVVILGKLQSSHSRLFTLLGVELENVRTGHICDVYTKASLDGKNSTNVIGTPKYIANNLTETVFRHTAKDHSLVIEGAFNLVTVLVRYTINGRR